MNFLVFFAIVAISGLTGAAYAQAGDAEQKRIEVSVGDKISVTHELAGSGSPSSLLLIKGEVSNLKVTGRDGADILYEITEGTEGAVIDLAPTVNGAEVKYELTGVTSIENGVTRVWDFRYIGTTTFVFPDTIEIVFNNNSPIYLKDAKGINCHGCETVLEFVPGEKKITKEIAWEDEEFEVEILTSSEISSFNFDQPTRSISFDYESPGRWATLIVPLELLGDPYQIWLDDKRLLTNQFIAGEDRAGLSIKPATAGTVTVIGATVIPEFSVLIPVVIVGIVMVMAVQLKSRIILR